MGCILPSSPFDLTLPLGSAPSIPFEVLDDTKEPPEPLESPGLAGAALWFAVKTNPTDADVDALIFASTVNGKISITDPDACEAQIDLTENDTEPTTDLLPNRTYYAFMKVQLSSGETRVRSGWVTTLDAGIEAP